MKKMIIALVEVICVQLIITLCYYEKTLVDKFGFETVEILDTDIDPENIENDSIIYFSKSSSVYAKFSYEYVIRQVYDEDHLPKVLDLKQKMCNVYLNDELLYTDCTSLDEHYDATFDKLTLTKEKYEKNKDFFGSNVRYYMFSSRHILIYEPGEYRIEIFLMVQLNGKEVLKKNSIKFTAIRQDDKDK